MVVKFINDWCNNQFIMYPTNYCPVHTSCAVKGAHNLMDIERADFKGIITNDTLMSNLHKLHNPLQKNLADMYLSRQEGNMAADDKFQCIGSFNVYKVDEPQREARSQPALSSVTGFVARMFTSITNAMTFVSHRVAIPPPSTPPFHDCIQCSATDTKDSGFNESDGTGGSPPLLSLNYMNDIKLYKMVNKLNCNSPGPLGFMSRRIDSVMQNEPLEDIFEDAYSNDDFEQLKIGFMEMPSDNFDNIIVQEKTDDDNCKPQIKHTSIQTDTTKTENIVNLNNSNMESLQSTDIDVIHVATNEINMQDSPKLNQVAGHDDLKHSDKFDVSSYEESPTICENSENKYYFDEVRGKFTSNSFTDSEDSFQIVFEDNPQQNVRTRKISDCDSEDSFIIFDDDAQENCFMSYDVFGSDYESSDSDASDSMMRCSSGNLSRTVSDLTDERLYQEGATVGCNYHCLDSEDEIDCATPFNSCTVFSLAPFSSNSLEETFGSPSESGILVGKRKKMMKKQSAPKKVTFSDAPPKVHLMCVWAYAAKQARIGDWAKVLLDRSRFKQRIVNVEMAISWVLKPNHRSRVMFHRFMPWWNAQKRQEKADRLAEEEKRLLSIEYKEQESIDKDIDEENNDNVEVVESKSNITSGEDNNLIIAVSDSVPALNDDGNTNDTDDETKIALEAGAIGDSVKDKNSLVGKLNKNRNIESKTKIAPGTPENKNLKLTNKKHCQESNDNDIETLGGKKKIVHVPENTNELMANNECNEFTSHTPNINNKSALYKSADTLICKF